MHVNLEEMSETLTKEQCDFSQPSSFQIYSYYEDYWVGLLDFHKYKAIALMSTICMAKKIFNIN